MAFRSHHPRGYVLVVTLGLLVLAATLLVAVGRVAVNHALRAREAETQLQRRWGAISCRSAILPHIEHILATAEAEQGRAVPVYRVTVQLGGQPFQLILSDEQAKANVNAMIDANPSDQAGVESRLRVSFTGTGLGNSVRLRPAILVQSSVAPSGVDTPATQPTGQAGVRRWISGLGQIFDNVPPIKLVQGMGSAPVDRITCWGPGGTNVMRASEKSLVLAAGGLMSQIDIGRLIDARDARFKPHKGSGVSSPKMSAVTAPPNAAGTDRLGRMLADAKITVKDRGRLPLIVGSSCHSLWIIVGDSRHPWHYLIVSDESNPQVSRVESFVW